MTHREICFKKHFLRSKLLKFGQFRKFSSKLGQFRRKIENPQILDTVGDLYVALTHSQAVRLRFAFGANREAINLGSNG